MRTCEKILGAVSAEYGAFAAKRATVPVLSSMRSSRCSGFTLVELLVAISITVLMLFLINQLFHETTNAVRLGSATSDIIGNARAVDEQFRKDAEPMVGPHEGTFPDSEAGGGIFVILNHTIEAPVPLPGGGRVKRDVRSDQLVFIRRGTGSDGSSELPIAPASNNTFSSGSPAPYIRVWYGHLRRTEAEYKTFFRDLNRSDLADKTQRLGDLGRNELASDWILGRQALFLYEETGNSGLPPIHVNGGWYDAPRVGDPTDSGQTNFISLLQGAGLYMALTDAAYVSLDNPESQAGKSHGTIVGGRTVRDPYRDRRLWASLADAVYHARAYAFTFGE